VPPAQAPDTRRNHKPLSFRAKYNEARNLLMLCEFCPDNSDLFFTFVANK
jgi:hypothetical protein